MVSRVKKKESEMRGVGEDGERECAGMNIC